ncbi:MAG: hypothetical protein ACI4EW_08030 [Butyrivibrio sp.]
MKIAGYDYLAEQNNRIQSRLQDFSTETTPSQAVTPSVSSNDVSTVSTYNEQDKESSGSVLKISEASAAAVRAAKNGPETASDYYAPVNFSTTESEDMVNSSKSGDSVLDRYRFFVQNTRYDGDEGIVRRIFR